MIIELGKWREVLYSVVLSHRQHGRETTKLEMDLVSLLLPTYQHANKAA